MVLVNFILYHFPIVFMVIVVTEYLHEKDIAKLPSGAFEGLSNMTTLSIILFFLHSIFIFTALPVRNQRDRVWDIQRSE